MWLDRLGQTGASTPQSNSSRAASPLPKRSSGARGPYVTSQRAGRGSSLSLVSNDSSSSLLTSSRRPNGSALKQSTTAGDNGAEALLLLDRILGPLPGDGTQDERQDALITEEDLGLDFDFGGLSLRELADDDAFVLGKPVHRSQTVQECWLNSHPP